MYASGAHHAFTWQALSLFTPRTVLLDADGQSGKERLAGFAHRNETHLIFDLLMINSVIQLVGFQN